MTGALGWLRRWGVSCASLAGGLLALFVFRRGLPHVAWIIGYLLLLWLLFAVLTQVSQSLARSERRRDRFVVTAVDYTVQALYHGLLLFVLPAYYAAATLTSLNVVFVLLLIALAVLATFDPWYHAIVHPRPGLGVAFFLLATFAALNVAIPLLGVRPYFALLLSAWVATVASTPAVCRALHWPWRTAFMTTAAVGVLAAAIAGLACRAIPPAPLFVARAYIQWHIGSLESLEPDVRAIHAEELRRRGLMAFTAIYAPAGLRQPVAHVWRQNGDIVDVITFDAVAGGRREGYRTWSRKTTFPDDPLGRWTVEVMTPSGQLIGRLSFRVVA